MAAKGFLHLSTNIDIEVEYSDSDNEGIMDIIGKAISDTTGIPDANVLVMMKGSEPIARDDKERVAHAEFKASNNLTSDVQAKMRNEVAKILKSKWNVRSSRFMLEFVDGSNTNFSGLFRKHENEQEDENKNEEKDVFSTS